MAFTDFKESTQSSNQTFAVKLLEKRIQLIELEHLRMAFECWAKFWVYSNFEVYCTSTMVLQGMPNTLSCFDNRNWSLPQNTHFVTLEFRQK